MGSCYVAKMDILTYHEPAVNLTFDELVSEKEEMVPQIAEALGLESTEEQIQNAINFLDKDKKHL